MIMSGVWLLHNGPAVEFGEVGPEREVQQLKAKVDLVQCLLRSNRL